jgi:protein TonB
MPPSPPALDPSALKSYGSVLTDVIGKRKRYPRMAQLRGWQGTTELKVLVSSDGKLKDVTVAHSSGFDVLDQQAISMVGPAAPDMPQPRGRSLRSMYRWRSGPVGDPVVHADR